ncbi:hypothetical protein CPC08DRAFT_738526 [Agrocybe pediades]|nr:hypothetical protein CPC08DRAFT_738526 [Agrocybe pediades]
MPSQLSKQPRDPFCTPLASLTVPQAPFSSVFTTPAISSDSFVDGCTPTPKRRQRDRELVQEQAGLERAGNVERVNEVLKAITTSGLSGHEFLHDFLTSDDRQQSSQAGKLLKFHGTSLLEDIQCRAPSLVNDFAITTCRQLHGSSVMEMLSSFSVKHFLDAAEQLTPSTVAVLQQIGLASPLFPTKHKDHDLIIGTTLCMLIKSRNKQATRFQMAMGLYFLASGTSKSTLDVLNHAGILLSYRQVISKLKQLGQESLDKAQHVAHSQPIMIIWDNINIAFKVAQQWQASKDHFNNGTTAMAIPLFGVENAGLPLSLKPPHLLHTPVLDFTERDLLPSLEEATCVQHGQLWHIQDILFDIPDHTTKQYPLPAMEEDESTLHGTLQVLKLTIQKSLKLTEEDIRRHSIILCAGDQLSLSLLDKVSAIRCDDRTFLDNISQYMEGQVGLLHVKFAHAGMIANEYWGTPNARSPWSLWKKAKSAPPFWPIYELILELTLPANIFDGFRLYCGKKDRATWIKGLKSIEEVETVAKTVPTIEKLRELCLQDQDLKFSIKRGNVGSILDLVTHLMLAFRGTGKTPKYAATLFHLMINLKHMDSKLRQAYLMNWLANLQGKENAFKEMDLLQEHQNFWLKSTNHKIIRVIYSTKGSNRLWQWLSMVSVSIFALHDVICRVQMEFGTPYNGSLHTDPSTAGDIKILCDYLEMQSIQSYTPRRHGNNDTTPAHNLLEAGAEYVNKPSAFRNFKYMRFQTTNLGVPEDSSASSNHARPMDEDGDFGEATFDDLLFDDNEFPVGLDSKSYFGIVNSVIEDFSSSL